MRAAILAATMLCGLGTGAQAAVRYSLVNPVFNQAALDGGAAQFGFAPVDITVSDAAVARGTFNVTLQGSPTLFIVRTGDVADLVSFHGRELASSTSISGQLTASLSFAADGSVSSGSLDFFGVSDALRFSGTSASFGGLFASEQYRGCNLDDGCRLVGQLVATVTPNPVPEPVSMSLLGVGLLSLAAARKRPNF